jgi:hypothetical protein
MGFSPKIGLFFLTGMAYAVPTTAAVGLCPSLSFSSTSATWELKVGQRVHNKSQAGRASPRVPLTSLYYESKSKQKEPMSNLYGPEEGRTCPCSPKKIVAMLGLKPGPPNSHPRILSILLWYLPAQLCPPQTATALCQPKLNHTCSHLHPNSALWYLPVGG